MEERNERSRMEIQEKYEAKMKQLEADLKACERQLADYQNLHAN